MRDTLTASGCSAGNDTMHQAMILAAGRGERLRPLTDHLPKPLIEVGGKPLIVRHLERLAGAGFERVVINLGWLGQRLAEALGDGEAFGLEIRYSPEPPGALETAGGIRHALSLFDAGAFAVISGDIWTDYPLARLREVETGASAHLVLVDNPPHHPAGDFALEDFRVKATGTPRLTFSGMARFEPELFADLAPGPRPLRPVLEAAMSRGLVSGEHHDGVWLDVGTPERLEEARRLRGN